MGKTLSQERSLEFLVKLSRMGDELRPGDRQNQREEVIAFLAQEDGNARVEVDGGSPAVLALELTDDVLNGMREWVEYALNLAVSVVRETSSGGSEWKLAGRSKEQQVGLAGITSEPGPGPYSATLAAVGTYFQLPSLRMGFMVSVGGSDGVLVVSGSLMDVIKWKTLDVLRSVGPSHLRICPICDRVFVRKRRAERCSRECTNKYWNDQALQRPGERERRRAAAKRHYDSKLPPNVKPRRNGKRKVSDTVSAGAAATRRQRQESQKRSK